PLFPHSCFFSYADHRHPPSFPTRRSSDLFDCLHDMGDPAGAARHVRETLAPDGTWMIVEPAAGDRVEDNLNPVGRAYYGFSTRSDRKSTRLNSSHVAISYAVFCLKKKI